MAQIGHHPAPGLGELIPGWFVVPANPITAARSGGGIGEFMPSYYPVPQNPIQAAGYRIPSIGEILPASFTVPQNPLVAAIMSPGGMGCGCAAGCGSGMCGSGMGDLGSDCGCVGGMCGCGAGMGFLESMDPMTLALVAGGLVLAWMVMAPGGSAYRQELASAKSAYSNRVARARSEHRGYKRVGAAAKRGLVAARS